MSSTAVVTYQSFDENAKFDGDSWIGVTDPKKRKQIQDRLAQRARRKRLAQAKKQTEAGDAIADLVPKKRRKQTQVNGISPAFISGYTSANNSESLPMLPIPMNVYSALYKNGTFLGLLCSKYTEEVSAPVGLDVPEPLRPTPIQMTTVHPLWIDRWPFPKMRDNLILLLDFVDVEDFLNDMFNAPSFNLRQGGSCWDPKIWSIEESFRKKWGFLFDESLFGNSKDWVGTVALAAPEHA